MKIHLNISLTDDSSISNIAVDIMGVGTDGEEGYIPAMGTDAITSFLVILNCLLLKLYFISFFLSLSLVRWMEGESQIVKFLGFVRILYIRNIEFTPRLEIHGAAWVT